MDTSKAEKKVDAVIRANPQIDVDCVNPAWAVNHVLKKETDPNIIEELNHLLANPKPYNA